MNILIYLKKIKNNLLKKENLYFLIIIFVIFLLDRYSKIEIIKNFNDKNTYVNDFFNISLIWNTGIGFGLLSFDSNLIYNLISLIIGFVIMIIIYIAVKSEIEEKIFFSIIIGGALGNFYDRVIYKAVPDFIDLHYNNFHWFTFNIADIFISVGIILFILKEVIFEKNEKI